MIVDTIKVYISILVRLILILIQGQRSARNKKQNKTKNNNNNKKTTSALLLHIRLDDLGFSNKVMVV